MKAQVSEQIELLRNWDLRFGTESVATSLAIFWGQELMQATAAAARSAGVSVYDYMDTGVSRSQHLEALVGASAKLEEDFGTWRTPWGEINRFQRLTGDIEHPFDDNAPSIPVGFASGRWGSLASFGARAHEGTRKWYGTSGNSFVAVVEFGERVSARAITAGGQSGDPTSPHFKDQAERYATGDLREVWFYRDDVDANKEREYRPGH
jgi:acyl-homoserine-lactone acylase